MNSYRDEKPLILNGPPNTTTVGVARDVSYFDFGADQYKCMCRSMHSEMGVIILTILGYISFLLSIPQLILVVSHPNWYTLPSVLYILFNLMLTVTLHSALAKENPMMMLPSLIYNFINVFSMAVILLISFVIVVVGHGNSVIERVYLHFTEKQLPEEIATALYAIMWIWIILITIGFLFEMWILEIQLKYYNCIRDKRQFAHLTTTYYVNNTDPRSMESHCMQPYM